MIKNTTKLLVSIFFINFLHGEDNSTIDNEKTKADFLSTVRDSIGGGEKSVSDGAKERGAFSKPMDNLLDVVIYYDTFEKYTNNVPYQQGTSHAKEQDGMVLAKPLSEYMREQKAMFSRERNASLASVEKNTPAYFVGGECSVVTPVEISKSSEFTTLNCILNFGGRYQRAEVFAGVYPDYEREILIALPIYATFSNGTRANFNGIILKENRGSINIADTVDSKRIRHLVAESALLTNDVAYRYASDYMRAIKYSSVSTKVTYHKTRDENGNIISTPISSTKVKAPKIEDYFMAAGIELASGLVGLIGKDYLYDMRPLFVMNKEKRVHIEGVVLFDNQGLAKKFGTISNKEISNSTTNNTIYVNNNRATAEKYTGAKKGVGLESVLNAASNVSQQNRSTSQYGIINNGVK